ncbi:MAG: bifunctional 5,10-methylene-tetrahydrofolate dehydrogenase/5,10-methylene-tetrahydrofolate cyclohydrolase [Christensenellaceae bacterium]|nr:bifunctional 5,10-methylene-tetrahydrofolate dehydrogenase/5,10-methylene-tetrahydrofolate cyclohydrolase [Christensenellaceae bacterium]
MQIIDGKLISETIRMELKTAAGIAKGRYGKDIGLAVILVGENQASKVYVKNKISACQQLGIVSRFYQLSEMISQVELISLIDKLNVDDAISGILVQLPLPKHILEASVIDRISPDKDVDGFTLVQAGRLLKGEQSLLPCTPKGIIELLDRYNIEISGANVVILGRSNIVGKPLFHLFLQRNATVTICHTKTRNISDITLTADILVSAVGRAHFVNARMVKDGAVVIDVGINHENGKLIGDVEFDTVKEKCAYITPVPGGVGPMTIAMLMSNTIEAYRRRHENECNLNS